LQDLGRYEEAIMEHRRVLRYWEAREAEYAIPRLRAHLEIARTLVVLGRIAEAEQEYEQTLRVVDPTAPDQGMRRKAREELAALRGGK
jgi:tetratricopeptide (TPR) repeat protein